jgi:gas vesicle protein
MGQDPSDIRAEIEDTRARVGNQVDALSYKTDVPARVGDYVDDKKQTVKDKVTGVKEAVTGTASNAIPSGAQVGRLKDTAERNPLGLAVGAAAIGFVAGLLVPSTKVENENMGHMSDHLIDAAKETAGDAVERGKQVAHDATEAAKESGKEEGHNLTTNLKQRVEQTGAGSQPATHPS